MDECNFEICSFPSMSATNLHDNRNTKHTNNGNSTCNNINIMHQYHLFTYQDNRGSLFNFDGGLLFNGRSSQQAFSPSALQGGRTKQGIGHFLVTQGLAWPEKGYGRIHAECFLNALLTKESIVLAFSFMSLPVIMEMLQIVQKAAKAGVRASRKKARFSLRRLSVKLGHWFLMIKASVSSGASSVISRATFMWYLHLL
jgi:hypothetical protein